MFCGYRGISLITCCSLWFLGVAVSDEMPRPENLSLSWSPDYLSVVAQWTEPPGLEGCEVKYEVHFYSKKCPPSEEPVMKWRVNKLTHTWATEENEVCVSVNTSPSNCGNKTSSKSLLKGLSRPPGLVKNFTCVYYSHMKMNCTWSIISNASDLQLFYGPHNESSLKPCVSYIGKGHMRTGCHLYGKEFVNDTLFFLVNGTYGGLPRRSYFSKEIRNFVKVPPPKLNISLVGKHLHIQSSPPYFKSSCWIYQFYLKKCNTEEKITFENKQWEFDLEYNEDCLYTVQVQARYQYCGEGGSDWSKPVYYGENRDPVGLLKMILVITPIIVTCCLIVALVLCRRHKDYLFPKIPEPSLLVKDMLNNSKDKGLNIGNLYIPYEDVVEKKLSLEPKSTFLHSEP
ncbi:interleukin-13 receptor subunit alpha-1-like isoform X2 [Pygocentrus nattereri]|uniref:Type I cytokine receptor cytokine-binding domain-containing protein n=1 Tax=Pygocentrus nattereri TaxID=42514 RepID=A0A3B4CN44_PYGNA|nr:interleukin-13 receptor subunit alpha-1-like isoform X2 [Pygocentrus nattereri]